MRFCPIILFAIVIILSKLALFFYPSNLINGNNGNCVNLLEQARVVIIAQHKLT